MTTDSKKNLPKLLDNSSLIRNLLSFPNQDSFYFLQILKRRKDNLDLDKDCVTLADYYIHSFENFDRIIGSVAGICERENARAYIRLNRRDARKLSFQVLKRVADNIASGNYTAVKGAYASCAGEHSHDDDRKWIVDIDWKDWPNRAEIDGILLPFLEELQDESKMEPFAKAIPTKNGIHLITRPFNVFKFKEKFPMIEVHKDNPTILFSPR